MKLLQVDTLLQARDKLLESFGRRELKTEMVSAPEAAGKILAEDIVSPENIPSFHRSSVDGYAVCSRDTAGATESIPAFLEIVEEVQIGFPAKKCITNGQCAYVPTGGMLPQGADAMVMVEYCELFDKTHAAVYQSAPFGKFVVVPGEDVKEGQVLLRRGTKLGPAHIGALAAAGILQVRVFGPLRVSILSTGDELVPTDVQPGPGQVRDINTWALRSFAGMAGMEVVMAKVLPDREELIVNAVRQAMELSDMVITSGGSSQGKKDMTSDILNQVSDNGVFTHGLALKPGKPTILGYDKKTHTLLAGLPGHPVAALTVFQLLLVWLFRHMTGQREGLTFEAGMDSNIPGAPGKATCLLVKISVGEQGYTAGPILGKSGLITTMAEADGYVMIDINQEGLKKGDRVTVHRFDI